MVKDISRTFPLDLMMKSVHFQVKKRLSFEVQKVAFGLSVHPPLSATSVHLA